MSLPWRILLPGLVLLLPLAAYAAGTAASPDRGQLPPRETIVIDEVADRSPARGESRRGAKDDDDRPEERRDPGETASGSSRPDDDEPEPDEPDEPDGIDETREPDEPEQPDGTDEPDDTDETDEIDVVTAEPDDWTRDDDREDTSSDDD